jgi:hypothetical protein
MLDVIENVFIGSYRLINRVDMKCTILYILHGMRLYVIFKEIIEEKRFADSKLSRKQDPVVMRIR